MTSRLTVTLGLTSGLAWLALLGGCHKAVSADEKTAPAAEAAPAKADAAKADGGAKGEEAKSGEAADQGVALRPEEIEALGIETTPAQGIQSAPEAPGFGVVLAHETVATAVAELRTASAAAHQSHAALERSRALAGTPGAMPAETQETAERQAVADEAALELARQRLSSTFGQSPPWKKSDNSPQLRSLASGQAKLVRVTFALGSLGERRPSTIRLARIDASQGGASWESDSVWAAPADAAVPGRSYFAILKSDQADEGDHLLAWTPIGAQESGVLVPAAAAVISGGKFWCYVEEKPGTFVRTGFDPGRQVSGGYFVKAGIEAGAKIVTTAAGQLLARESNPAKGGD